MILGSVNRPLTLPQRPLSLTVLNLFLVNSVGPNAALMRLRSWVQYQCGLITNKSTVSGPQLALLNQASHSAYAQRWSLRGQGERAEINQTKSPTIMGRALDVPLLAGQQSGFGCERGEHSFILARWPSVTGINSTPSCRGLPNPHLKGLIIPI